MTVNPFWFGVLMTIVVEIMLVIFTAIFGRFRESKEDKEVADELSKSLNKLLEMAERQEAQESSRKRADEDDGK